jgi:hypothetical protein
MKTRSCVLTAIALAALFVSNGMANAQGRSYSSDNRAVTNWLVVVNYPEACASMPCTEADIFGSLPENPTKATVCYLTGQIVGLDGKAVFAGRLGEGTSHGCFFPQDPNPLGLNDAMRAEIHVIVQEHGAPLKGSAGREQQVTQSGAGCNPDCMDTQFAIHEPANAVNGVSVSTVNRFSDDSPITNAQSTLFRDREGVRVVTDTHLDPVPAPEPMP